MVLASGFLNDAARFFGGRLKHAIHRVEMETEDIPIILRRLPHVWHAQNRRCLPRFCVHGLGLVGDRDFPIVGFVKRIVKLGTLNFLPVAHTNIRSGA